MKRLILIVLILTLSLGAGPKCPCPPDTQLVAKYEWEGEWVFAEGEDVVDIVGDSIGGTWISEITVKAVSLKAGQNCYVYTYDSPTTEGEFSNGVVGGKDISNIQFCKEKPTSVVLATFSESCELLGQANEITVHPLVLVLVFLIGMVLGYFVILQRRIKNGS